MTDQQPTVTTDLPQFKHYDFACADAVEGIPFATGDEASTAFFHFENQAGLAIVGISGAGKTAALQSLTYGSILRGARAVIVDLVKEGWDFEFARDYLDALATSAREARFALYDVQQEVMRRTLAPIDAQRAPALVVVIDSIDAIIAPGPDPEDDPNLRAVRELVAEIGRHGPDVGVHLILAAQRLNMSDWPELADIKTGLARIIVGPSTPAERQSALRNAEASPVLGGEMPRGRAIWEEARAGAGAPAQLWYAAPAEYSAALSTRVKPVRARG